MKKHYKMCIGCACVFLPIQIMLFLLSRDTDTSNGKRVFVKLHFGLSIFVIYVL